MTAMPALLRPLPLVPLVQPFVPLFLMEEGFYANLRRSPLGSIVTCAEANPRALRQQLLLDRAPGQARLCGTATVSTGESTGK